MDHEQCTLVSVREQSTFVANATDLHDIRQAVEEYQIIVKNELLTREVLVKVILEINAQARSDNIKNQNLNLVHKLIFNPFEKYGPMYYGIGSCKWLVLGLLLVFYLLNTMSDLILSLNYAEGGHFFYSSLTLMCTIVPSLCYTFAIYRINHVASKMFVITFNVSPFLRCLHLLRRAQTLNSLSKSNDIQKQEECFSDLCKDYETLPKMKQLVGILSCVPQLTLQVVIFLTLVRSNVDFERKGLHWFSIITSIIGLLIALESRFQNNIFEILWLFPIIIARVLTLCILTYRYPVSTLLFLAAHWLALFVLWYVHKLRSVEEYSDKEKLLYASTEALVTTFVPLKFLDVDLHLHLYIFYFIQNVIANVIWVTNLPDLMHSSYLYALVICINITYFIIGIISKCFCKKITMFNNTNTHQLK